MGAVETWERSNGDDEVVVVVVVTVAEIYDVGWGGYSQCLEVKHVSSER